MKNTFKSLKIWTSRGSVMKKLSMLIFLALSANAFSAITYTNDSRYLYINDDGSFYSDSPSPKFSNFDSAYQTSSLTAAGFSAVGHGAHYETRIVTSLFQVTFNTDEAVNLSLTGSLILDIWQGDGSYVLFNVFQGESVYASSPVFSKRAQWVCNDECENPVITIDQVLFLNPGKYTIYITEYLGSENSSGWYNVQGQFSPVTSSVPVPSSAWLMGSGLLGLGGISRRKK